MNVLDLFRHSSNPREPATSPQAPLNFFGMIVPTGQEAKTSFHQDFIKTLEGQDKGLGTSYLYYDPKENYDPKETPLLSDNDIRPGACAWENLTGRKSAGNGKDGTLGTNDDDVKAITHAIDQKIVSKLPREIDWIEYGSGGSTGFAKPSLFLEEFKKTERHVKQAYAIDIFRRFSNESLLCYANALPDAVCQATIEDILNTEGAAFSKQGIPVIAIFGGLLENTPDMSAVINSEGLSSLQGAVKVLDKLRKRHGSGSCLIKTYNAEQDPDILARKYPEDKLTPLLMTFFYRARDEGIIVDKSYIPENHWEMSFPPPYDEELQALRLSLRSKNAHTIEIRGTDGHEREYSIDQGQEMPVSLSCKWDFQTQTDILNAASYDVIDHYRPEGSSGGLILAQAR